MISYMKFKSYFLLLLFAISVSGCIDEIKLDIDTDQQKVIVDGLITDSLQVQTIKISYSAVIGVGNDNILTPIPGATVKVLDDAGNSFDFPETESGIYQQNLQGEAGRAYHVEVILVNGKKIQSHPYVLTASIPFGAVEGEVVEESTLSSSGQPLIERRLELKMNLDVSGLQQRPYLRWRAEGEYEFKENYPMALNTKACYVKNNVDLNSIKVFNTNDLGGDMLVDEPIVNTAYDYRFAIMYCFHVSQYAISEAEYKYWNQIIDIVNIDGSLFDPPPGTVSGNLFNPDDPDEQILGYFSAAGVTYRRVFMNENTLGFFAGQKCSNIFRRPDYPECRECTILHNSTTEKPEYWIP